MQEEGPAQNKQQEVFGGKEDRPFAQGDRVEAVYKGEWFPGEVLEVKENGQKFLVRCDANPKHPYTMLAKDLVRESTTKGRGPRSPKPWAG